MVPETPTFLEDMVLYFNTNWFPDASQTICFLCPLDKVKLMILVLKPSFWFCSETFICLRCVLKCFTSFFLFQMWFYRGVKFHINLEGACFMFQFRSARNIHLILYTNQNAGDSTLSWWTLCLFLLIDMWGPVLTGLCASLCSLVLAALFTEAIWPQKNNLKHPPTHCRPRF